MDYAIWLRPPEPLYSQIKKVIDDLAVKYSAPQFEPHMTLQLAVNKDLSEVKEKVNKLAETISSIELSLGPISFSTTYFQSVFIRVNSTASLMQLNLDAKKILGEENSVFMPHISLLYGDHDMATREKVSEEINLPTTSFGVKEFIITPATLNPDEWQTLATIPFNINTI